MNEENKKLEEPNLEKNVVKLKETVPRKTIGKTSSPEREPNTTSQFQFWLADVIRLNPFDFVTAEHLDNSQTIGIVQEIKNLTDAESHLTNFVSHDFGKPQAEPYVERVSSTVAQIAVIRNTREPELMMPVPPDRNVYFSTEKEVRLAIGADQIKGVEIPAGVIRQSNGDIVAVGLDSEYLLGPQAAHINASGISGLATKTSYLMFLLQSVFQKIRNVAFIIFNVKQSDLLHIHERNDELCEEDEKLYGKLGIECKPFENVVKYFLPRGSGDRPNSDSPPSENLYSLYAYTLADVFDRFDLLFADVDDQYHTLDTYNLRIRDDWDRNTGRLSIGERQVETWTDLRDVPNEVLQHAYNLNPVTPPRIKRELIRLTSSELFVNNRPDNCEYLGEKIKEISAGKIFVIDITNVPSRTQPFVVGDIMRSIDELYKDPYATNRPSKLILFIDELNTIAPAGSTSAITEQIVEVSRKGRSRGTVLFGAEQFKSDIHDQIVGNCGTHVIGRTGSAEIRRTAYSFLDETAKQNIMNLAKGEMVLSTPNWRSPIKIEFPKPAYKTPKY
jgi:DNA helicase HerA-like ATPase